MVTTCLYGSLLGWSIIDLLIFGFSKGKIDPLPMPVGIRGCSIIVAVWPDTLHRSRTKVAGIHQLSWSIKYNCDYILCLDVLCKWFDCVISDEAVSVSAWCFIGHREEVGKSERSEDTKTTGTVRHVRNISLQGRSIVCFNTYLLELGRCSLWSLRWIFSCKAYTLYIVVLIVNVCVWCLICYSVCVLWQSSWHQISVQNYELILLATNCTSSCAESTCSVV